MKFLISHALELFYYQNQFLNLLSAFKKEEIERLSQAVHSYPEHKMLYAKSPVIARIIRHRSLLEIVSKLSKENTISLGIDLVIDQNYPEEASLEEIISIQGVIGAALVALDNLDLEETNTLDYLPKSKGDITLIAPSFVANWQKIAKYPLYLMVYTKPLSRYLHQEKDPYTHLFKNQGYIYGDLLRPNTHPILYH